MRQQRTRRINSALPGVQRREMFIGVRYKATKEEVPPVVAAAAIVEAPVVRPVGRPVEIPKGDPKSRFWSADFIVMLAGLGFLIASTGLIPYLVALFSRM